jgi:predicted TIM-barrel fold metal-dependent hydrolase
MLEAGRRFPGKLLAYARIKPGKESPELLRKFATRSICGLKLHPVGYRLEPTHPYIVNLVKEAGALGLPTLFHCGDEEYGLPLQIAELAKLCPETRIILGHMGGYFHVDDAITAALKYPNIILETSAMPYPEKIKEAVQKIGAKRILFASDGPGCLPALEVHKILCAGLNREDEKAVFAENYLELLPEKLRQKTERVLREKPICQPIRKLEAVHDARIHVDVFENGISKKEHNILRIAGISFMELEKLLVENQICSATLISGFHGDNYQKANIRLMEYVKEKSHLLRLRLRPEDIGQKKIFPEEKNLFDKVEGIFLHPWEDGFSLSNSKIEKLCHLCREAGKSVMVAGGYPTLTEPSQLLALAESCPKTDFIFTSAGQINICGIMLESAWELMKKAPNVKAETSGIYRQDFIERLIRDFGPERVIFGSGHPLYKLNFELCRMAWLADDLAPIWQSPLK